MKTTFLKSKYWIIYKLTTILVAELLLIVAYIITISMYEHMKDITIQYFLVCFFMAFIFVSPLFLAPRVYLSKINISNEGIRWFLNRKTIIEIKWEDILDVRIEMALYRKCMVFDITKNISGFRKKELSFNIDKENIETIYKFCKNDIISKKVDLFIKNKNYKTPIFIWQK